MIGHAVWVPEMMPRSKSSEATIAEVIPKSKTNNHKMISQAISTGDQKLDELAWKKTKDECDRTIAFVVNTYDELVDMFGEDIIIAVRRAIWERHGNARDWSVRVIDDFLAGLQNSASSYCCVHRPATRDDVIAQVIAARGMVPAAPVQTWTSDFAKAYRQVPQLKEQLMLSVVAQFCPDTQWAIVWWPNASLEL